MADIIEKITLMVGGDATQAKKILREVEKQSQSSQGNIEKISRTGGKKAGDAFGNAMTNSTKKSITVMEDLLRTYGGTAGRILGDVLKSFRGITEAKEAAAREAGKSVAGGGGAAAGAIVVGDVAGSAVGAKAAIGGTADALAAETKARINARVRQLRSDIKWTEEANAELLKSMSGGTNHGMNDKLMRGEERLAGWNSELKDLNTGTATFGKLSLVAAGAIVGVIGAFALLNSMWKETAAKMKELGEIKLVIRNIEELGNEAERTAAILDKFGASGLQQFDELKVKADEIKESLGSDAWTGLKAAGAEGWNGLINGAKSFLDILPVVGSTFAKFGKQKREQAEVDANLSRLQLKFGEQELAKIKEKEVAEKLAADVKKTADEADAKALEENIKKEDELLDLKEEGRKKELSESNQYLDLLKNTIALEVKKNKTIEENITLQKMKNELIDEEKKLTKEAADAKKKASEDALKKSDESRLTLSELAGSESNNFVTNRAREIQDAETARKELIAQGRFKEAEELQTKIDFEKSRLVGTGALASSELSTLDTEGMVAGQGRKLTPSQQRLIDIRKARADRMNNVRDGHRSARQIKDTQLNVENQSLVDWIKDGGVVPVKPFNGK
jgi:hypothetical protein